MTVGELYDKLKAIEKAELDVQNAENSLLHGGSAWTMDNKRQLLTHELNWLETLRNEEIEL